METGEAQEFKDLIGERFFLFYFDRGQEVSTSVRIEAETPSFLSCRQLATGRLLTFNKQAITRLKEIVDTEVEVFSNV